MVTFLMSIGGSPLRDEGDLGSESSHQPDEIDLTADVQAEGTTPRYVCEIVKLKR